jgi:hypothetical protein
MIKKFKKQGIFAITQKTIDKRRPEVVALMRSYGMSISESDPDKKLYKAFISLIPRSRGFRNDFSNLASEVASEMTTSEVSVRENEYSNYIGDDLKGRGISTSTSSNLQPSGTITTRGVSGSGTTTRKSFDETRVGQILSNDSIKNLINTGLGVYAYRKTGGTLGQDNVLNSATVGGGGATSADVPVGGGTNQKTKEEDTGMGVGTIVLIAVGGLALIGGLLFIVNKGTNKP